MSELNKLNNLVINLANAGIDDELNALNTLINKFAEEADIIYTVLGGDTLSSIAQQFYGNSSSYKKLMEYNGLTDASRLSIGDKIKIPKIDKTNVSSSFKCKFDYKDKYDKAKLLELADCIAKEVGVGPALFKALIDTESNWNPDASNSSGAIGLTQLTAAAMSEVGVSDPYDPVQNLYGGAKYLKKMLMRFSNHSDLRTLGLMAYHAGVTNVLKWIEAGKPEKGTAGVGKYTLSYPKTIVERIGKY